MTAIEPLHVVVSSAWPGIDACDRCLALSELTVTLWAVPCLRGTPEYEARQQAKDQGETGVANDVRVPAPLVDSHEGLAPTPGELVRAADGVSPNRARSVAAIFANWSADGLRERCLAVGLSATCRCSTDYPAPLHALADPPPVLYIAGDARLLDRCPHDAVGMVGTRRPTRVGRDASRNIGMGIAQMGGIVVSGMALGVDGASHEGALAGRGATIAVLASGADRPSPMTHRRLYDEIRHSGAVVSELPPGTHPTRWTFPARNRIIAGLSSAVIVVEAPRRSGALITVDHAHDLGVDVLAVPGSLASMTCEGSNALLCEGAGGVVDGVEFMASRGAVGAGDRALRLRPAEPGLALVHDVLAAGPQSRQEIGRSATTLQPLELEEALTDLELSGWVERGLDGRYRLTQRVAP